MHAIFATLGTDGDVFPHIGLGAELAARGHRVTLACPEAYRERVTSQGMEFYALVTVEETDRILGDPDLWHPIKSGIKAARWGRPMILRQYEVLSGLARQGGRRGSVLVANAGVLAARLVQEKQGTPMATLLLQPGLLPSSIAPPEMPAGLTIPKWLPHPLRNVYWLGVDGFGYSLVGPWLNRVRRGLGLPPVRRLFRWWLSPELVVGLFPSWYAAPQADWPPQVRLAGFAPFDGSDAALAEELQNFCTSGPPPVVFTLGTGMAHASEYFRAAVETCRRLEVRGILATKYEQLLPAQLPPHVIHCRFAPFRKLLPLCAAVVHHGGVGTTATALEAGCPQLVLPLAWDQPDNAARVERLGAGLALGSRRRRSEDLQPALAALMSLEFRERCQQIASRVRAESSRQQAAGWIEELHE
jgi:rhamnosyltransferase subunit B